MGRGGGALRLRILIQSHWYPIEKHWNFKRLGYIKKLVIVLLVAQIRGGRFFYLKFFHDHKTLCRILHIFLKFQYFCGDFTPWPSIMIVATVNGISAPNFTMSMNATKFHITMPQKLSDGRQAAHAHSCCPTKGTLNEQTFVTKYRQLPNSKVKIYWKTGLAGDELWTLRN